MIDHLQNLTAVSYRPNHNQLKFLEACLNSEVDTTITARCSYAGISRDTFYRWNQDPGFREWLTAKVEGFMPQNNFQKSAKCRKNDRFCLTRQRKNDTLGAGGPGEVWEAILREAKKGNVQAQKLFLERVDTQYICRRRDSAGNELSLSLTLNQSNRQYGLTEERLRRIGIGLKEAENGICC